MVVFNSIAPLQDFVSQRARFGADTAFISSCGTKSALYKLLLGKLVRRGLKFKGRSIRNVGSQFSRVYLAVVLVVLEPI